MTTANLQMIPLRVDRETGAQEPAPGGELAETAYSSMEAHPAWPMVGRLPVLVAVGVALRGFKVRDLLALQNGRTVTSSSSVADDIPVQVGALQICWGEFEVVEQRIAIRLTRLA
jgi:flagellar motor switch/type III secretory pathway protein FliN